MYRRSARRISQSTQEVQSDSQSNAQGEWMRDGAVTQPTDHLSRTSTPHTTHDHHNRDGMHTGLVGSDAHMDVTSPQTGLYAHRTRGSNPQRDPVLIVTTSTRTPLYLTNHQPHLHNTTNTNNNTANNTQNTPSHHINTNSNTRIPYSHPSQTHAQGATPSQSIYLRRSARIKGLSLHQHQHQYQYPGPIANTRLSPPTTNDMPYRYPTSDPTPRQPNDCDSRQPSQDSQQHHHHHQQQQLQQPIQPSTTSHGLSQSHPHSQPYSQSQSQSQSRFQPHSQSQSHLQSQSNAPGTPSSLYSRSRRNTSQHTNTLPHPVDGAIISHSQTPTSQSSPSTTTATSTPASTASMVGSNHHSQSIYQSHRRYPSPDLFTSHTPPHSTTNDSNTTTSTPISTPVHKRPRPRHSSPSHTPINPSPSVVTPMHLYKNTKSIYKREQHQVVMPPTTPTSTADPMSHAMDDSNHNDDIMHPLGNDSSTARIPREVDRDPAHSLSFSHQFIHDHRGLPDVINTPPRKGLQPLEEREISQSQQQLLEHSQSQSQSQSQPKSHSRSQSQSQSQSQAYSQSQSQSQQSSQNQSHHHHYRSLYRKAQRVLRCDRDTAANQPVCLLSNHIPPIHSHQDEEKTGDAIHHQHHGDGKGNGDGHNDNNDDGAINDNAATTNDVNGGDDDDDDDDDDLTILEVNIPSSTMNAKRHRTIMESSSSASASTLSLAPSTSSTIASKPSTTGSPLYSRKAKRATRRPQNHILPTQTASSTTGSSSSSSSSSFSIPPPTTSSEASYNPHSIPLTAEPPQQHVPSLVETVLNSSLVYTGGDVTIGDISSFTTVTHQQQQHQMKLVESLLKGESSKKRQNWSSVSVDPDSQAKAISTATTSTTATTTAVSATITTTATKTPSPHLQGQSSTVDTISKDDRQYVTDGTPGVADAASPPAHSPSLSTPISTQGYAISSPSPYTHPSPLPILKDLDGGGGDDDGDDCIIIGITHVAVKREELAPRVGVMPLPEGFRKDFHGDDGSMGVYHGNSVDNTDPLHTGHPLQPTPTIDSGTTPSPQPPIVFHPVFKDTPGINTPVNPSSQNIVIDGEIDSDQCSGNGDTDIYTCSQHTGRHHPHPTTHDDPNEISVLNVIGRDDDPNVYLPHARKDCRATKNDPRSLPTSYCPNCYCYICDSLVTHCAKWACHAYQQQYSNTRVDFRRAKDRLIKEGILSPDTLRTTDVNLMILDAMKILQKQSDKPSHRRGGSGSNNGNGNCNTTGLTLASLVTNPLHTSLSNSLSNATTSPPRRGFYGSSFGQKRVGKGKKKGDKGTTDKDKQTTLLEIFKKHE